MGKIAAALLLLFALPGFTLSERSAAEGRRTRVEGQRPIDLRNNNFRAASELVTTAVTVRDAGAGQGGEQHLPGSRKARGRTIVQTLRFKHEGSSTGVQSRRFFDAFFRAAADRR